MFGYVRPCKPELKIKDFAVYKAVYCGLCHTLGRRYRFPARMILSYDATFFAIVQMSLNGGCCGFEKKHCPVPPFKKCDCAGRSSELDFWADVSVLIAYYKILDNIHDNGIAKKLPALLLLPLAGILRRRAELKNPFAARCLSDYISEQNEVEKKRSAVVDEAAHPTAKLISQLLKQGQGANQSRVLERMGYFLGRWIYLADAADDLEDDLKNGGYNPFVEAFGLTAETPLAQTREKAEQYFNSCIYEMTAAFQLLETKRFSPILANVLFDGMPLVKKAVLTGLSSREKRKRFPAVFQI